MLDVKAAEQIKAFTYDQKPIHLDGQIDTKVSFAKKVIITTVYIKLVAPDQLLLTEKVCRLLGILNYYPSVKSSQPIVDVSCVEQQEITCDGGALVQVSDNNELTNQEPQDKDSVTFTKNVLSAQSSGILEPSTKEPNKDVNVIHPAMVSLVKAIHLPACIPFSSCTSKGNRCERICLGGGWGFT